MKRLKWSFDSTLKKENLPQGHLQNYISTNFKVYMNCKPKDQSRENVLHFGFTTKQMVKQFEIQICFTKIDHFTRTGNVLLL